MSELKDKIREAVDLGSDLYEEGKALVKITKDEDGNVIVMGNEAGLTAWGLDIAGAAALKDERRTNLPGLLVTMDPAYFTKDSDIKIHSYLMSDDISGPPESIWPKASIPTRSEKFREMIVLFGCGSIVLTIILLTCIGAAAVLGLR